MKLYVSNGRVALAGALSLAVAVVALAVLAAPAFALAPSGLSMPGHGFFVPVQGAGNGSASPAGWLVVAILAATVAIAAIGWRHDRRAVAQTQQTGPAAKDTGRPSASKPLPMRGAPALRARHDQGVSGRISQADDLTTIRRGVTPPSAM